MDAHKIAFYQHQLTDARNVNQLVRKIDDFISHYNKHARPFMWTATADSILEKIERLCTYINGTAH